MGIRRSCSWKSNLFIALVCLSRIADSATHCDNPFTEEDISRQCDNMITNFKADTEPSLVIEEVIQAVLSQVNIGDKGTFGLERGYRVSRIEIALFGESEEKLFFNELRNFGDQLNRNVILVKSCQGKDEDKPGDLYATASVQIFLEEIDERSIEMMARESVLRSGESSMVSIELSEAECPKKGEKITLRKEGPGQLPDSVVTDNHGRVWTQFQAEEKGETKVEALYEGWRAGISITTLPLVLWDLDCDVYFWEFDPDFPRTGWNDDHWRSKVKFVDLPLTQLAEADFTAVDPESAEGPSAMNLYMKWLPIKKFYEGHGSFFDSRFTVFDGEVLHHGKVKADPEWIIGFGTQTERFDYSQRLEEEEGLKTFILFKLKTGTVVVSVSEKAGVKTPWSVRFERRFRFPTEEILFGEPFTINYEEPGAGDIHSDVEIRFTPREVEYSKDGNLG